MAVEQTMSSPPVRLASALSAALLVVLIVWWALAARIAMKQNDAAAPTAVEAIVSTIENAIRPAPAVRAPTPRASGEPASATSAPAGSAAERALSTFSLQCATAAGRRAHPAACAGIGELGESAQAPIAPRRVDGVLTSEGAVQRALLQNLNSSARTYALGEAQKYLDPRQDPLYEEGTDPATAAMRPCPAGQMPVGSGAHLTGRTCQPYR
jgi:hypothetical protein